MTRLFHIIRPTGAADTCRTSPRDNTCVIVVEELRAGYQDIGACRLVGGLRRRDERDVQRERDDRDAKHQHQVA